MITHIKQDITTVSNGFILHQTNTRGVMGGGLARQLREKYPECAVEYTQMCHALPEVERYKLLGTAHFAPLEDGRVVVNLFGQLGTSTKFRETEYHALRSAMLDFKAKLRLVQITDDIKPIHIPYLIGCGLGGGNWDIVESIINDVFKDIKNDVFICALP